MSRTLYYDSARVDDRALEKIVLNVVLLSDGVLLNNRFNGVSEVVNRKLAELSEARFVKPWALPGDVGSAAPPWIHGDIQEMPYEDYSKFAAGICDAVSEYRARQQIHNRHARITDLVHLSTELWATCICAHLGAERIICPGVRARGLFERIERADYEQRVAQAFLELNGLGGGFASLSISDIEYLRKTYQDSVGNRIAQAARSTLAELGNPKRGANSLTTDYQDELRDFMKRHGDTGTSGRAKRIAVDILGIFLWPVGVWGIVDRVLGWGEKKELPLVWFMMDVQKRISKSGERGEL